jgi:hypothetical protein
MKASDSVGWAGWRGWFAIWACIVGLVLSLLILTIPEFQTARGGEVQKEVVSFWAGHAMSYKSVLLDRLKLVFGIFQHLGFALLPIALIARLDRSAIEQKMEKRNANWWYVIGGTMFLAMTLALYASRSELFPYLGNSVTAEGFGPRIDTIALTNGHQMSHAWRMTLSVIGSIGGLTLIWVLSRSAKVRGIDWRAPSTLIGILGLAHLGLVLLNPNFFDRYLVPLLPFLFIWLAPLIKDAPKKSRVIGWVLVCAFFIWSIWGTVDYLGWTKSKWDLATELTGKYKVPASEISAGYEPDGFYNFKNEFYVNRQANYFPNAWPWWNQSLILKIDPKYVVVEKGSKASGELAGYGPSGISNDRMEVWVREGAGMVP